MSAFGDEAEVRFRHVKNLLNGEERPLPAVQPNPKPQYTIPLVHSGVSPDSILQTAAISESASAFVQFSGVSIPISTSIEFWIASIVRFPLPPKLKYAALEDPCAVYTMAIQSN